MIFLKLAFKSIRNRGLSTFLTVISISLSMILLLAVERTRRAAEENFTQSVSQVDLLVGARTGPLNLILYSVFNMGSASNNISWQSYEHFKNHPTTDWTIPYSLGDGHRGFRIVATDENFYEHYRFKGDEQVILTDGKPALGIWDAVIGSDVQKKLNYSLTQKIIIAHGVTKTEGIIKHGDRPFTVTGIMKPTGTALDQSIYISLKGMEAIHMDWHDGAPPLPKDSTPVDKINADQIKPEQITSFFLRTKSRISTLSLQREINTYAEEPLLAIIPGSTLADLWHGLGSIEQILKAISWMVVIVGLAAMLSSLLSGLNERRREMAILRSLGASPKHLILLLVLESGALTALGVFLGVIIALLGFNILNGWMEQQFGLYLTTTPWTTMETFFVIVTLAMGFTAGLIPAVRASRLALKDGLSVKV